MERLQKKEEQKATGGMGMLQMAKAMGNQAVVQRMPVVIQKVEISEPKYTEAYIRNKISRFNLSSIAPNCNCSGFVDEIVQLAFDEKYLPWNSLTVTGAVSGYSDASDYDILLFYSQGGNVAKHISFKVGSNSVGRNQGDPITSALMFEKPIANFEAENFTVHSISAYNLIVNCGIKNPAVGETVNCCNIL